MQKTDAIKLLAIDDKPDNLTALRAVVQEAFPQTLVLTATNGCAGIELAAAEDPDVILLDIIMPGMDGFEVCRRLKADDRFKDIPVVFLTALKTDTASRVKALEVGGEGFLAKPLETVELTAQIRAMTKVKAANRSQRAQKERLETLVAERTADLRGTLASMLESERLLAESETRFKALHNASFGGIAIHDQGIILECNLGLSEMTGYDYSELIGMDGLLLIAESSREAVMKNIRAGYEKAYEAVGVRKNGEEFALQLEARNVPYKGKQVRTVEFRDITERKQVEQELRESEAKFRRMVETFPLAIHQTVGVEQITEYVNPTMVKLFGYTHADIPSVAQWWPLAYPDETYRRQIAEEWTERVKHAIATQSPIEPMEVVCTCKDGSKKNISWGYIALGDKNYSCGLDITERKRSEEALRNAERNLRSTVDGLSAHIAVIDEHGEIILANKSYSDFAERNGIEPRAVSVGTNYLAVCDAASGGHSEEAKPFAKGIREVLSGKRQSFELEYPCHSPDEKRWFIGRVTLFSGEGPRRVIVAHENITERKQAEAKLRESEAYVRAILDSLPIGIAVNSVDDAVNFNYLNDNFLRFYRITRERLTDADAFWNAVYEDPDFREEIKARVLADCASRDPSRMHWENIPITRAGFETRYISAMNTPIPDRPLMISAVWDVTERKHAEAELQKMDKLQSVGILAGGIAHDFNNILLGLFGNISIAMDDLPKEHPSYAPLEEAEKSMSRAVRLTKQLLTFAKGGAPVKEYVSLGDMVEEVARFDLTGSNVRLVYHHDADLWPVNADKGQLQQVVANLVINARQAMPSGGHLTVTLENEDLPAAAVPTLSPGRYVKVTVRDEGEGISPKVIEHIFDPYFTTTQTGTGLGLATVWSILNKHNGHIGVVSELGKGTTFTFYLPASAAQLPEEAKPPAAECPAPARPAKILVMDDEASVSRLVVSMLEPCGYTVATAADAQAAIALYKEALKAGIPFDLVVMDLTIPGGPGGKEVIQDLLALDPRVHAIVSSGYADDPVMANPAAYGFKGTVAKPYTARSLREAVARVLA